jgi:hypothetical protein
VVLVEQAETEQPDAAVVEVEEELYMVETVETVEMD